MTADKDDSYLRAFDTGLRSGFEAGHGYLIGDYTHCRSCQRPVRKGRRACDDCQQEIDQSLKNITGEEMPQEAEQEPDRLTTEIEWRDARKEKPDEDTTILIVDNGIISSVNYYDQGRHEAIILHDQQEIKWSEIDFWAPIPDDLPPKDWTLEVLNRQLPGWETLKKGEHYVLETEIQGHGLTAKAVKQGTDGARVHIKTGTGIRIKNVQYRLELTASFEMALEEAIKEISIKRRKLEKIESALRDA